jgi:hypothetical protein
MVPIVLIDAVTRLTSSNGGKFEGSMNEGIEMRDIETFTKWN